MAEQKKIKVKVKKRYVDRFTKEICEVDSTQEYTSERVKELQKGGYVEPIEEKKG